MLISSSRWTSVLSPRCWTNSARAIRKWTAEGGQPGSSVLGYGAVSRTIGSVSPVECPSMCFTPAVEALEIQPVRTPAYPVFVTEEPAFQRESPRDLHAQGHLRHVDPNCPGDSRQNGCRQ